jgi:hypothetical protein
LGVKKEVTRTAEKHRETERLFREKQETVPCINPDSPGRDGETQATTTWLSQAALMTTDWQS